MVPTDLPARTPTRTDIQALRGLAVLYVLLFHTWPQIFRAGYLGVDVFFVISGFLITRLVKRSIVSGDFTFLDFYGRRFRRLLPAAYVTFLFTAIGSVLLLTSHELHDFLAQLIGAVTFTANLVIWRQTGYFDQGAFSKPLLHVWSLAIEEQYYLLLPAALVLTPRRFWKAGALSVCVASFALWLYLGRHYPSPAFYLLPTRAWELAIGSVGTFAVYTDGWKRLFSICFWPSLAIILAIPVLPAAGWLHPFAAPVACLATMAVILKHNVRLSSAAPARAAAFLGDFSYSLYLVHWPILVLFRSVWLGEVPMAAGPIYAGISVAAGYVLYKLVENPLRHGRFCLNWQWAGVGLCASAALISIPVIAIHAQAGGKDFNDRVRPNFGLSPLCDFRGDFAPLPQCATAANPSTLVWGDSLAMHLVTGLAEGAGRGGVMQATRSLCGPLIGMAPVLTDGSRYNQEWAKSCTSFNSSVLAYLSRPNSINVVVLSSLFRPYVMKSDDRVLREGNVVQADPADALAGMARTVRLIRSLGKRVVVVSPPPSNGINMAWCAERRERSLPMWGVSSNCAIPFNDYALYSHTVLNLLDRLETQVGVNVIRLDSYLCQGQACATTIEGDSLYLDDKHLSREGSQRLSRKIGLQGLVDSRAK